MTWEQDAFAYADAWDEAAGRYVGLVAGSVPSVLVDGVSVRCEAGGRAAAVRRKRHSHRESERDPVPGQRRAASRWACRGTAG